MDAAKQPMLSVRIPVEIMSRLDSLAAVTGRTKTFYVRQAICEHISDMEDLYLAEREMEEVRAGRSVSVPLEELMKQYGLAD